MNNANKKFEASSEDDLRKVGFSKDGKFTKPQIVLGSFVAYIVYKEFERKLKINNIDISIKSAIDDIKTMYGFLNKDKVVMLSLNERQQKIYDLFF